MPERLAHSDSLRAEPCVTLGPVTLLPIARTVLHARAEGAGRWFTASKHLHALVVHDAAGIRALDADGRPAALQLLRQQLPELDARLAGL